jgi:hypothetical protein
VNLDLTDLLVEDIEIMERASELALESLSGGGHAMTETGASVIGAAVFLCSCCCCC